MKTIAIPLGGKIGAGRFAWVDEIDYELVKTNRWTGVQAGANKPIYARRSNKFSPVFMHQVILGISGGHYTDHINGSGIDNRRCNLRSATFGQNNANKGSRTESRYRGILFRADFRENPWVAQIARGDGRGNRYIGRFSTAAEAAAAYDREAIEAWGPFARLNFPTLAQEVPAPTEIVYVDRPPIIQRTTKGVYKGVSRIKKEGRWRAQLALPGQHKSYVLGYFDTPQEAAIAYNQAAIEMHGDLAVLNDI